MSIDIEKLATDYGDKLREEVRNWHKGQHVGLPKSSKEIGAQVDGFVDGYNAAQSQQLSWVSVKDRLPDYDVNVLWIDEHGHSFVAEIDHDNDWQNFQSWHKDWDNEIIPITHWMPLLAPPNESTPTEYVEREKGYYENLYESVHHSLINEENKNKQLKAEIHRLKEENAAYIKLLQDREKENSTSFKF